MAGGRPAKAQAFRTLFFCNNYIIIGTQNTEPAMNNLQKLMKADSAFDDWLRQEMADAGIDPDEADGTQRTGGGTFSGNYRIVCGNDIDKRCRRKDVAIRYAKMLARRLNARVYIYVADELYLTVYRGKVPRTETVYFDRKQEARYVRYA